MSETTSMKEEDKAKERQVKRLQHDPFRDVRKSIEEEESNCIISLCTYSVDVVMVMLPVPPSL